MAVCALLFIGQGSAGAQEIDDCIECHEDRNLTKTDSSGKVHSLFVDKDLFIRSVHGELECTCVDCHEGAQADSHPAEGLPDVKCAECHEEIKDALKRHQKDIDPDAPECYDCHGMHDVLPSDDPKSSTCRPNLVETCGKCHEKIAGPSTWYGKLLALSTSLLITRIKAHGKVNMAEGFTLERCTDCHYDVVNHGYEDMEPKVCVNCHSVEGNRYIFGTIHRTAAFDPYVYMVLPLCYLVAIVGLFFYFRPGSNKKKTSEGDS